MKNRKFIPSRIILSLIVILVIIAVSLTTVLCYYGDTLDMYYGRGTAHIVNTDNSKQLNVEYYQKKFKDEKGTLENAMNVSKKIEEEGIVLLKNNGVLPLSMGDYVTPMGTRFVFPIYSGSGSGGMSGGDEYRITPYLSISKQFELNNQVIVKMTSSVPNEMTHTSTLEATVTKDKLSENTNSIFEYDSNIYSGLEDSCYGSVGLIFIGRSGGESENLSNRPYFDGTPHVLALSENEKKAIKFSKSCCKKTVVILNTAYVMEIGELMSGELECDAILWVGCTGVVGYDALGRVLAGEVVPSGRTADIWPTNLLNAPTQKNFCDIRYSNTIGIEVARNYSGDKAGLYFIEYEEGVYMGYRYYETAYDIGQLNYGSIDENGGGLTEKGEVNYPFGYGLSYTTFKQSIVGHKIDNGTVSVTIEVENTGERDGKEVIQLYYTPPYTDFDKQNLIEKPTKNLVAFDKVFVPHGEKKQIILSFDTEDMASYFYMHNNVDGTKGCYFLENGTYTVTLGKDSHRAWDSFTLYVDQSVFYEGENIRSTDRDAQSFMDTDGNVLTYPEGHENNDRQYTRVSNRFDDVTEYMLEDGITNLSRSNWSSTHPTYPEEKELSIDRLDKAVEVDVSELKISDDLTFSQKNELYDKQVDGEKKLMLAALRGRSYYDPLWDVYLNQLDYTSEDFDEYMLYSRKRFAEMTEIGKPAVNCIDGPQGLKRGRGNSNSYPCEVVVASSFNVDLAYDYGVAIGQEALFLGVTGWYGPGLNIHRDAFLGRNFEYYSEDALLSGKMAAKCISGAAEQGLIPYVKHFALDNYEGPTSSLFVWATEQTIREIYLKSFEIALKEAVMTIDYNDENGETVKRTMRGAIGVMSSVSCIGVNYCSASYELLESILRGEWGFQGSVICDMALRTLSGTEDAMFNNGCDIRMGNHSTELLDKTSKRAALSFRRAVKNMMYSYANSNLMQGLSSTATVYYDISPWCVFLIVFDIVIASSVALLSVFLIKQYKLKLQVIAEKKRFFKEMM